MDKIHNPIIQRMRSLPCQQSDTVILCTRQSLQRWRTKTNDVQTIQLFVIKYDSIKKQPNDNGLNSKLKSIYNVAKSAWMLKYGTTKFSPHHMKSILVEAWDTFKMSSENIIRDRFAKTKLTPPSLPI